MKNKRIKVGIVGIGMVGNALKNYFEKKENYQLFLYDKNKNIGSMEEVNEADFIYICVPTPYNEKLGCNIGIIEEVLCQIERKSNFINKKVVIIKSTVVPGTTERLQQHYPHLRILFNPEFLTEITSDQDMNYPDRQLIGYTKQSYNVAKDVLLQLPLAPYQKIILATEAETIKYFGNCWFATKVVFANQFFDLCQKLGVDYDIVMSGASADKRIGRTHLKIWHKGYRGYGNMEVSRCLPKDLKSLIKFADSLNIDMRLLKVVDEINTGLWEKYGRKEDIKSDKDIEFTSSEELTKKTRC